MMISANALQALLSASTVMFFLLGLMALNVQKDRRQQQMFLPFLAVAFSIVSLVVLYRFNDWFDRILDGIFRSLPFVAQFYQVKWLYTLENLAIIVLFAAVKFCYRFATRRLFIGEQFFGSAIVELGYRFDSLAARWYVRHDLSQLRTMLRWLYAVSLAVVVAMLMLMSMYPEWPGFTVVSFPAVAALILGEVFFALDGQTKAETSNELVGDIGAANRVANYGALREVYRGTFPERIINDGVDLSNSRGFHSAEAIKELQGSPNQMERLYAEYFERVKQSGFDVDESLMHASIGLIEGTSTLINTPFISDLTPYISFSTYVHLLRGGRCLVIAGRDASAEEVTTWVRDGLQDISGVPDLWDVRILNGDVNNTADVGVLRAADLHNTELLKQQDDFFGSVELVIIAEPSRMLATGQLGLSYLVSRVSRETAPVYVAFDRNHDGLIDALSHLLKIHLTDVVATHQVRGASSEMVWDAAYSRSDVALAPRILPGISRYLGVGTELAALALKHHVEQVQWIGGERFPVVDMVSRASQYYGHINAFAEMQLSQRALTTSFQADSNPFSVKPQQHQFLIVEDEVSNLFESLRMFASRSTENGFLHLIAEDYLLRDYMVDHRDLFQVDAKAVPSIVPDFARTERNTVLRLLMTMSMFDIPKSTLMKDLELSGSDLSEARRAETFIEFEDPVILTLQKLTERYTGIVEAPFQRVQDAAMSFDYEVTREPHYRLARDSSLQQIVHSLRSAYFLLEDETENHNFLAACLYGHVQQTLLPGQFISYAGKYYEVQSIGVGVIDRPDEVVLRRAAEHITGRPVYRPLLQAEITNRESVTEVAARRESENVRVTRERARLSVQTFGYLDLPSRSHLAEAKRVIVDGLPSREYINKEVLRIELPGVQPSVRRTIALLLSELFVTLFPLSHNFLLAVTEDEDGELAGLLPETSLVADDEAIYIAEDSLVDLGLIIAVERNWRRLFETITDYLAWQTDLAGEEEKADTEGIPDEQVYETPIFPDDKPEDVLARERRLAEFAREGKLPEEQSVGIVVRLWRWLTGLRKRRRARRAAAVEAAQRSAEQKAAETTATEPTAAEKSEVDSVATSEQLGQPRIVEEPQFEFDTTDFDVAFSDDIDVVAEEEIETVVEEEPVAEITVDSETEIATDPETKTGTNTEVKPATDTEKENAEIGETEIVASDANSSLSNNEEDSDGQE